MDKPKPSPIDTLPEPLRTKARQVRVHFDALKDLLQVLEQPHVPAERAALEQKASKAYRAAKIWMNDLCEALERAVFGPDEIAAYDFNALEKRFAIPLYSWAPPYAGAVKGPELDGVIYHDERQPHRDSPRAAIDALVLQYHPELAGSPRTAQSINRVTGLAFRDGEEITWESVSRVREALEQRASRTIRACLEKMQVGVFDAKFRISDRWYFAIKVDAPGPGQRIELHSVCGRHELSLSVQHPAHIAHDAKTGECFVEATGLPTYELEFSGRGRTRSRVEPNWASVSTDVVEGSVKVRLLSGTIVSPKALAEYIANGTISVPDADEQEDDEIG